MYSPPSKSREDRKKIPQYDVIINAKNERIYKKFSSLLSKGYDFNVIRMNIISMINKTNAWTIVPYEIRNTAMKFTPTFLYITTISQ